MQKIDKGELYQHVQQFLKQRGVRLEEGSYTRRIQHGCSILADTVNLSQQAVSKATSVVEKRLDRVRQVIHEKTAPKAPTPAAGTPPQSAESSSAKPEAKKAPKAARKKAPTRAKKP
jgi:hypothetical protein